MLWSVKKVGRPEWLAVFLGNPGPQYEKTRHNAGFMAADFLSEEQSVRFQTLKFRALTDFASLGGANVLLMKPQTYMNLSGEAVRQAAAFYKLPPERVIVVCDDVALPLGKLRVRRQGSAGGHNGLKNIIEMLGSDEFPRVKIGVGAPPHTEYDLVDWVIGKMAESELMVLKSAAKQAVGAVYEIIAHGVDAAMNQYN